MSTTTAHHPHRHLKSQTNAATPEANSATTNPKDGQEERFRLVAEEGNRLRFSADGDALGNHLDIVLDPKAGFGRSGAGSVHHIAFRSADYEDQKEWLAKIEARLSLRWS